MKSKTRLAILLILAGLVLVTGIVYFLKGTMSTEKTVKIVDYGHSTCTEDIPPSGCGPYNVTVQSSDGQHTTYKVAGFSNRDNTLYAELTSKITMAKEQKTPVTLKVNNKGEVISVK